MRRYKRLGNEGDLNENNFDDFIEEIDDASIFLEAEKVPMRKQMVGKSTLLPEKMMSSAIMPIKNTKDKFKRAFMAGRQRPREDDCLSKL